MNKKPKVIFGTGMSAKSFIKSFPNLDYLFFLDNDVQKHYQKFEDYPILNPDILLKLNKSKFEIIVASEFYDEISDQLKNIGFKEGLNFFHESKYYLDKADIFIISFMKCGRTWLRYLIGNLIELKLFDKLEDKLSYTDCISINEETPIIKAYHDGNPHLKKNHSLKDINDSYATKRILFLVRDPRDVSVSLYYHFKYRTKVYEGNIDDFTLKMIPLIINYYNNWIIKSQSIKNFKLIKYEDLHHNPIKSIKTINKFCLLNEKSEKEINIVLENSSFKNMRKYETSSKANNPQLSSIGINSKEGLKVRKGKIGSYKTELKSSTIEKINHLIIKNLDKRYEY